MKFKLEDTSFDFIDELKRAKKWWDWWNPADVNIEFVDQAGEDICPIGSLDYVLDYYKSFGIYLRPLNIPKEIFSYGPGGYKECSDLSAFRNDDIFYVKSESIFKDDINGLWTIKDLISSKYYNKEDKYQLTNEIKDINSEWRIFVYQGNVVDAKCYLWYDSPLSILVPKKEWVEEVISKINFLPAYTLDIMIDEHGNSYVLEVHDFFSCGLYGFSDYRLLPFMFYRSHNERRRNLG